MIFAQEFEPAFYRSLNGDLAAFSDEDLRDHYIRHGKTEGRRCSPMAERADFIVPLQHIQPALEIGPFYRPVLLGDGVRYFDVLDTDSLKKRARQIGGNPEGVPHIDYVGTDLGIVTHRFRLVLSSHSIEHQPDLILHLQKVAFLLEVGGLYAVLAPDCRYCFDHFLAPSNLAEVFAAYEERRTRHTLTKVIEHRALTTHNDAVRHWHGDHGRPPIENIRGAIAEHASGRYVDVHAWQFTPTSFREIVTVLQPMTGLAALRVYETPFGNGEFCAVLERKK
jgi:hypothetical protein